MKRKITVITDAKDKVVATQLGDGVYKDPKSGIEVWLEPGPQQRAHSIEIDLPEKMGSPAEVEAFHKMVEKHLSKRS